MTARNGVFPKRNGRSSQIGRWTALGKLLLVASVFVVLVSYAVARSERGQRQMVRTTDYPEQWIRASGPPAHAGYFRKRFDLPGPVKHAWLKIVATDAFEVSVNRNPLGHIYLWRPTRPFQNGTSEKGQRLLSQEPAMALNFPREYQWDGHETWRIPSYLELTSSLRPGKNVIAIEIESRLAPARVAFEGEIELFDGTTIPIRSDESWLGQSFLPGPQLLDWTEIHYWDRLWHPASKASAPRSAGVRLFPEQIYTEPFAGRWMRHPDASSKQPVWFRADWTIDEPIEEAYLRLTTSREFELYVNGTRVRVASVKPPDLDNGSWVFGRASAHDPTNKPELLDPDEVGSNFVGDRFETPRKADGNLNEFRRPFSPQITPFRYIRTYNRAQDPGVFDPKRTLAESRRTPETPDLFPEKPRPNSLKRDLSKGGYLSYCIASLLNVGANRIEIRCEKNPNSNWPAQVAVDGGAIDSRGNTVAFPLHCDWKTSVPDPTPSVTPDALRWKQPEITCAVLRPGTQLPRMQYRGVALHPDSFERSFASAICQVMLSVTLVLATVLSLAFLLDMFRGQQAALEPGNGSIVAPLWKSICQTLSALMAMASLVIVAGLLVECSWVERHEFLWCIDGSHWRLVFATAAAASTIVVFLDSIGRYTASSIRDCGHSVVSLVQQLPSSRLWPHLILWVLLLAAVARGYKVDLQPLDDDEYASTQAVLAILEGGSPAFVPDGVFYTRSPLFHYVTAAFAWPFGGDLWSLRMQTVGWGVATAWLTYLCGSHLLRNRWIGFLAMLLMCLHPFEIFTGHVIRFYQMQQFFALLTMYCFCRGFVCDQSQRYRIATLFVFLLAVLSQEITVAMGPSLVLGYLVFAKDLGWRRNITLVLISASVVALIGLDFVTFQTLCLTRTEGVSPSIEAAVKPHFWYPMNLLSIFIGYSRLHVVPSFFLFVGLLLQWREHNRNTFALISFLLSGVVMTNLLVTHVSLRYLYWLFPVWMLLCVDGMSRSVSLLASFVYPAGRYINRSFLIKSLGFLICVVATLASWSLWRIPNSYELRILGDSTGAVRWVKSQKRQGDRVAITEPHTHCAFIESGKCDYDIAMPLLYDFAVMRDGVLVDRNGGGEVISSLDQLIHEFSQGHRIWILLNREKFRTRGKNMRWEYPGARFETFVRKNCELKHRTYLWSVYLWDPARGHFQPFQLQE